MKGSLKKFLSFFALALLILLVGVTPAFSQTNNNVRVWVEYQSGHRAGVETEIRGAGAQVHYNFDRLNYCLCWNYVRNLIP